MDKLDVVVIGAGLIGLAIGRAFARAGRNVTIIESKSTFGTETSARNSEVIHAGIYYPQMSLKAKLCVSGRAQLYRYCQDRAIDHKAIGKLILAVDANETDTLVDYQIRGNQNGVRDLRYLSSKQILDLEPKIQAVAGLLSPSTGIIDSRDLMMNFISDLSMHQATIVYNSTITSGYLEKNGPIIRLSGGEDCSVQCNLLVNSGGLSAPKIARSLGVPVRLIPSLYFAKGHYYNLSGPSPFSHLVYPVGNHDGLGIHGTLNLAKELRFGPNVQWVDTVDYRFDDRCRDEFIRAIRRYYPSLDEHALQPGYTGIRPKLVGPNCPPGDFLIQGETHHGQKGLINCYGIESPGLTASMAIADYVVRIAK